MSLIDRYMSEKRVLSHTKEYARYMNAETGGIGHALDKSFSADPKLERGIVDHVTFSLSVPPGSSEVAWGSVARALSKYLPQAVADAVGEQEDFVERCRKAAEAEALEVLNVTTDGRSK